jgi:hypothetical protein
LEDSFGDQLTFWIYPWIFRGGDIYQINATLLAIGEYCYVYLDNATINRWGYNESLTLCTEVRDDFDTFSYPNTVEFFGHPDGLVGDIDGDPKVTLLIVDDDLYCNGYYYGNDIPGSFFYNMPGVNHREIIHVFTGENPDSSLLSAVLAHEFSHLIWANYELTLDMMTLAEGYACYASYNSGYLSSDNTLTSENSLNRSWYTDEFSINPDVSLLFWYEELQTFYAHYGKSEMFIFYLVEKYGEELLEDLKQEDIDGPEGIEIALSNAGYDISFNDLFLDWITACTIDEEEIENGLYSFENTDFTINKITTIDTLPFTSEFTDHYAYGIDVKKLINPPDEFTIQVTNPHPYSIGISAIIYDDNGWSITQTINADENSENLVNLFSGENIEFAYIVTSMMNQSTPTYYLGKTDNREEVPMKSISYSFLEGHVKASYSFLGSSFLLVLISSIIVMRRRNARNAYLSK